MKPPFAAALVSLTLFLAPALAQEEVITTLETHLAVESRLLEGDLQRYRDARRREQLAAERVDQLAAALDAALAQDTTTVVELRRREVELDAAREAAGAVARETAETRRQIYARMERLAELGGEAERIRSRRVLEPSPLSGLWRFELGPDGDSGVVEMRITGTLVRATYRLMSGARGSLAGTVVANRFDLEKIDARRGFDAVLAGVYDPTRGEISGRWDAVDVASGGPSAGSWTARRLDPSEEAAAFGQP